MKQHRRLLAAVAATGVIVLSACTAGNGAAQSGSLKKSDGLTDLVITSGGYCICHAPLYVGMAKHFFQDHGLRPSLLTVTGGFAGMGALESGSAQVADAVSSVAGQAAGEGVDAEAVLVANGDPTGKVDTSSYFAIIARKGSGITAGDLHSLRGKTIGVAVGTIADQYRYYTLKRAGMNPDTSVRTENIDPTNLVSALQSSSVDAIVAWEPTPLEALQDVPGAFTVARGGGATQYLFSQWMPPSFVRDHPRVARNFVAAFMQSMQYAREHVQATAAILQPYFKGLSAGIIEQDLRYLDFDPRVSALTLQAANQGQQFTRAIGVQNGTYSFAAHLDLALIRSVEQQYPQYLAGLPSIPEKYQLPGTGAQAAR
jgi:ABC-type nitrate/sulfonate/bicarbonate transport system substrate-binding protein